MLGDSLDIWGAYLARLYQIRQRYRDNCAEYLTGHNDFFKLRADARPDDWAIRFIGGTVRVQLEIESFYVSMKLLLERVATTFGWYFGKRLARAGSDHAALAKSFSRYHSEIANDRPEPERLQQLITWLDQNIVKFRNIYIEHPALPNTSIRHMLVESTDPDGCRYLAARARSTKEPAMIDTASPDYLIRVAEEYIDRMLGYFDTYRAASIIKGVPPLGSVPPTA